ncbi:MAG: hypothetical protein LBI13_01425 [Streptococcaceae bacterium]|jgi:hypothetical protein|nr:hypothetical protein [Streptococcaceae bacterium]
MALIESAEQLSERFLNELSGLLEPKNNQVHYLTFTPFHDAADRKNRHNKFVNQVLAKIQDSGREVLDVRLHTNQLGVLVVVVLYK